MTERVGIARSNPSIFPFFPYPMSDNLSSQRAAGQQAARPLYVPIKRRSFFAYVGATAGATTLLLAGCDDDDKNKVDPNIGIIDVGAGDTGVLNYAYALEQLEAAFYAQVLAGSYFTGLAATAGERQILADIAAHEKIHADFFKAALGLAAIKPLTPDFITIDFTLRVGTGAAGAKLGVLDAARAFEDLGVAAYNGAGQFITDARNLTLAGKIVSVEARHAALIRDLIAPNSFVGADVVNFNLDGLNARQEKSKLPTDVLAVANTFLANGSKVSATKLV